jgi:excisionase family DNA binding protein
MEDRWLFVDEIVNHLGIRRVTVYKWISERRMPGYKIGRNWRFRKGTIGHWLEETRANEPGSGGDR